MFSTELKASLTSILLVLMLILPSMSQTSAAGPGGYFGIHAKPSCRGKRD